MALFQEFQTSIQIKGYIADTNYTELCNTAAFDRALIY
jgi:hypothetical protein